MNNLDAGKLQGLLKKLEAFSNKEIPEIGYKMFDGRGKDIEKGNAYVIGTQIAKMLKTWKQEYFLLVGDGRLNTEMILTELSEALSKEGIKVLSTGQDCSTPLFEVERNRLEISGLMITASHQSKEYNGLKMKFDKTPNIEKIENEINGITPQNGVYNVKDKLYSSYIKKMKELVKSSGIDKDIEKLNAENKAILFDGMNGVSSQIAKDILGNTIKYHRDENNGSFPLCDQTLGPDPGNRDNFINRMPEDDFSIVVGTDPDGDRGFTFAKDQDVSPTAIAALWAECLLELSGKDKGIFVAEYTLGDIIKPYLESKGIEVIYSQRGRPNVIDTILKTKGDNVLGGAETGLHLYSADGVDDGMLNALTFIHKYAKISESPKDFMSKIESSLNPFIPEVRIKSDLDKNEIYKTMENKGWEIIDGPIYQKDGLFVNLRGSSNGNEYTLNANGKLDLLKNAVEEINQVFPDLANNLIERSRALDIKWL